MSEGSTNFYLCLDRYGERPALLISGEKWVSHRELAEKADTLGEHMEPRRLVLVVCSNTSECIVGYLGALRRKTVPILINAGTGKLTNLLSAYEPDYIYAPLKLADDFDEYRKIASYGRYALLQKHTPTGLSTHPDLALLLTTSGSTGSPKLVRLSRRNITANAESIVQYLNINPDERAITSLPMGYTYGLSIINSHLLAGASIALTESTVMQKEFWNTLCETGATTFGGVPYTYEMLHRLRFDRMETPSLRYLTQAGGRLHPDLVLKFAAICRDKGLRFIVMYGQSEATARMSYLPWENVFTKPDSIGIAIPGGEFSLGDGDDATGRELLYRGENVCMGYAETAADLARGDDNVGELHTGDMASRDRDGYYYIVGRKSRFLKIFGNRVSLTDLERDLERNNIHCICAGIDNRLKIFVPSDQKVDEVRKHMDNKPGINRQGYRVYVLPETPRTENGKIHYAKLDAWEE